MLENFKADIILFLTIKLSNTIWDILFYFRTKINVYFSNVCFSRRDVDHRLFAPHIYLPIFSCRKLKGLTSLKLESRSRPRPRPLTFKECWDSIETVKTVKTEFWSQSYMNVWSDLTESPPTYTTDLWYLVTKNNKGK